MDACLDLLLDVIHKGKHLRSFHVLPLLPGSVLALDYSGYSGFRLARYQAFGAVVAGWQADSYTHLEGLVLGIAIAIVKGS